MAFLTDAQLLWLLVLLVNIFVGQFYLELQKMVGLALR